MVFDILYHLKSPSLPCNQEKIIKQITLCTHVHVHVHMHKRTTLMWGHVIAPLYVNTSTQRNTADLGSVENEFQKGREQSTVSPGRRNK